MNKRYIICYRTENGGKDVVERHTATKSSITRTARDIASFSRAMVVYEIVEEASTSRSATSFRAKVASHGRGI